MARTAVDENSAVKEDMKRSIRALRRGNEESPDICFLGIDHFSSKKCLIQLREEHQRVINAVLDAQDDGHEEQTIALISTKLSKTARGRATYAASSCALSSLCPNCNKAGNNRLRHTASLESRACPAPSSNYRMSTPPSPRGTTSRITTSSILKIQSEIQR